MTIQTHPGTLGPIACVTITAPDLDAVESCYTKFLDYRVSGRGTISRPQAELWTCPALGGHRYLLLGPAAGDDCVFRFIEAEADENYVPFSTYGWNAAEIMVENVDEMAVRLAGSPFKIIGEPANLSFTDDIRAMQILGPGNELLYLTEFKQPIPGLDTPVARCTVDLVFIVILGGPSMEDLQNFYAGNFGVPGAPAVESRVKGMSAAFGFSPEQRYPIAALPLAGQALIEVDEMPAQAKSRPAADGHFPSGIAMVSFRANGNSATRSDHYPANEAPYLNARGVSVQSGSAGELIEVIHMD
jgi:hypothetical protein